MAGLLEFVLTHAYPIIAILLSIICIITYLTGLGSVDEACVALVGVSLSLHLWVCMRFNVV